MPRQRQRSLRELFREFCLNTTFQGFKYFYIYPDKISRFFWTLNIVGSMAFAWILVMLLYSRFDKMPTRITIENQYSPVENMPFPAVTLCSPNQMTISNMVHFNRTLVDGNVSMDLESMLIQALGYYEQLPDLDYAKLQRLQELIDVNRHFVPVVMASLAQSCNQFLRLCIYEDSFSDCSDLFRPILTKHGLCCIFNSPYYFRDYKNDRNHRFKKFMPITSGLKGALTVVSDYNPENALDGTLLNAGAIRVSFNDYTEFPADDESCLIYPHQEAFLIVYATHTYCSDEVKTLPPESRRCLFDYESHSMGLPHMGYRNSDCDTMCFVKTLESVCHCTPFYVPQLRMAQLCNLTSVPCITQAKYNLAQNEAAAACNCPRDCDSRHYRFESNVANMGAIQHLVNNPYAFLKINRSTTIMHISFANAFYVTKKQETVISLINLVSNLGGVFGLCLGCSAFSVLEVLFYLYLAIKHRFFLKPKRIRPNKEKLTQ